MRDLGSCCNCVVLTRLPLWAVCSSCSSKSSSSKTAQSSKIVGSAQHSTASVEIKEKQNIPQRAKTPQENSKTHKTHTNKKGKGKDKGTPGPTLFSFPLGGPEPCQQSTARQEQGGGEYIRCIQQHQWVILMIFMFEWRSLFGAGVPYLNKGLGFNLTCKQHAPQNYQGRGGGSRWVGWV